MKIIIQRVNFAEIFVNNKFKGKIQKGIVAYIGVANGDSVKDIDFCIDKLINLRIFDDENGKLNLSVKDIRGELLIVSNFTIYGNTKKGRRPSYTDSAAVNEAQEIYNLFVKKLEQTGVRFETGEFGQYMRIVSENDGPVNLIIDSK
ncbi:D-tyrosyl-tRNA(Tyr) deacylase [Leptotrichia hofstadii]|uniref:D-aminoacyl-tRNA deacylase n=1 Tax=Leptotrichia hofstadii TaxID=157688 RepID=A0A510JIH1_9FUSO|nr:D-aminoacyl-tRNA deacylase [Leptotrichia hofstadii]BBM39119.1 D-tyrosyl-tRNA(Tyr) deacylase [Leptotrichia hofstadii]